MQSILQPLSAVAPTLFRGSCGYSKYLFPLIGTCNLILLDNAESRRSNDLAVRMGNVVSAVLFTYVETVIGMTLLGHSPAFSKFYARRLCIVHFTLWTAFVALSQKIWRGERQYNIPANESEAELCQRLKENPDTTVQTANRIEIEPLKMQLRRLYWDAGEEFIDFSHLEIDEQVSLRNWLARLQKANKDYTNIETRNTTAKRVTSYLMETISNSKFKETFFLLISNQTKSCGDSVALSNIRIDIAYKLEKLDLSNFAKVAHFLGRGIWAIDILQDVAETQVAYIKTQAHPLPHPFKIEELDELQIILYYPIQLREMLKLPFDKINMQYETFTAQWITLQEVAEPPIAPYLKDARDRVEKQLSNEDRYCEFLIENDTWLEALKKHCSTKFQKINEDHEQRLEDNDTFDPTIHAKNLQKHKQDLISLTKKVLKDSPPWKG